MFQMPTSAHTIAYKTYLRTAERDLKRSSVFRESELVAVECCQPNLRTDCEEGGNVGRFVRTEYTEVNVK